jgi:hypothetical protein
LRNILIDEMVPLPMPSRTVEDCVAHILTAHKITTPYSIQEKWRTEQVFAPFLMKYPELGKNVEWWQMYTEGYLNLEGVNSVVFTPFAGVRGKAPIEWRMRGISFENSRRTSLGYVMLMQGFLPNETEVFYCEMHGSMSKQARLDLYAPLKEVSFKEKLEAAYNAVSMPHLRLV